MGNVTVTVSTGNLPLGDGRSQPTQTPRKAPQTRQLSIKPPRLISPVDWRNRALELALAERLAGTASWHGLSVRGAELLSVPERARRPGERTQPRRLAVRVLVAQGPVPSVVCECAAGAYHQPCAHAGAVYVYLDARQKTIEDALRHQDRYEQEWRDYANLGGRFIQCAYGAPEWA